MKKYKTEGLSFAHSIDESPDNKSFRLHVHDDYEILCVVSGGVGYIVEGKEYDLSRGSIMIMRRAEIHRLVVKKNEKYERYIINFSPELLEKYGFDVSILDAYNNRALGEKNQYMPSDLSGLDPIGHMRQMAAVLDVTPNESVAVAYTVALLCSVNTAFYAKNTSLGKPRDVFEERIVDYINEHILDDISLSDISESMHISVSQLNRVFNRMTGMSVYNYIVSKRLVYAQGMISRGESAINACQTCGFKDYSSFYRLYKKRFGTSPTGAQKKNISFKA
ncbi:MAG: AraC family transcriptional regulator [Ruminococcaceae bacterium]|nr:AraC family transcriptional regulator [Oscillospiraceae bacterium]